MPPQLNRHELGEAIFQNLRARYDIKEQILGAEAMRYHERIVCSLSSTASGKITSSQWIISRRA